MNAIGICYGSGEERIVFLDMIKRSLMHLSADVVVEIVNDSQELFEREYSLVFLGTESVDFDTWCSVAEKLNEKECKVVAFSPTDELAKKCYGVHPAAYIAGPYKYEVVLSVMKKCKKYLFNGLKSVLVTVNKIDVRVNYCDVYYATIKERMLTLTGSKGSLDTSVSMTEFEKRVVDGEFLRCHRAYIVNMNHINKVDESHFILEDGTLIPISNDKRGHMVKAYESFLKNAESLCATANMA